jgi:PEP-CTERM motif-containing protein
MKDLSSRLCSDYRFGASTHLWPVGLVEEADKFRHFSRGSWRAPHIMYGFDVYFGRQNRLAWSLLAMATASTEANLELGSTMKRIPGVLSGAAAIALGFGLLLLASPADADSIGGQNSTCGSCFDSKYTLQWTGSAESASIYDITLTVNTQFYNGGAGNLLDAVAIKVTSSTVNLNEGLDTAPGGIGNWAFQQGGLNAGGCDGAGSGFVCAQATALGNALTTGVNTNYVWVFDVNTGGLTPDTGLLAASVKALYVDSTGKQAGITSEDITLQPGGGGGGGGGPVPEPSALLLLGAGVTALGAIGWRRTRR